VAKEQQEQEQQREKPSTVDEDEWAAFEADIAAADYAESATISAPAMTSEQSAAAKDGSLQTNGQEEEDGDPRRRTTQREADLQDEKEDARRALEEEFDEMQNLEAKVLKLKQQRDALKQRAASHGGGSGGEKRPAGLGKENNTSATGVAVVEEADEEEGDESDEDEDDGWDGFRFRTGVR